MNNNEIKQKLPHRWPFLLVDRVTKISKQGIEGFKNVSASDIIFLGHFPEVSILPGVLIIEALAQISGLFLSESMNDMKPENIKDGDVNEEALAWEQKIGFLTSVRSFKFLKTVEPGDQLFLKSMLAGNSGDCFIFKVSAYVDSREVASGEIQLFLQKKEKVI